MQVEPSTVGSDRKERGAATVAGNDLREFVVSWRSELGVGTGLMLLILLCGNLAPNFLTLGNFSTLLRQASVTAIVAVGMTMVIIAGEIDLSVGAMVGLSGVVFSSLIVDHGVSPWIGFVCVLALAAAVGGFTAGLRNGWGIPSFITTIGLLSVLRGVAFFISDGVSIGPLPEHLEWYWYGDLLGVYMPTVLMAVVVAVGGVVLAQSRFGLHLYALGGNTSTAARYGVQVRRLRVAVFVTVQALAAIGGVLLSARLNAGTASNGELFELDVIAAVIVGGTSLGGGVGRIVGTVIGVLFVAVLRNGMLLMGVKPIVFMIAQGTVIILAVWWSMLRRGQARSEIE